MKTNFNKALSLLDKPQRKAALGHIFLAFVGMLLETLGVGIVIPTVALMSQDKAAVKSPYINQLIELLGNPSQVQLVVYMVCGLVAIYFLKLVFLGFLAYSQSKFALMLQADLSQKLFQKYLRLPYTFHLQHNSAQLINNVQGEVGVFTSSTLIPAILLFSEFLVISGLFLLLLIAEPIGAVISVIVLGSAAWLFNRATKKKIKKWSEKRYFHEFLRIQHLQQGLGGVKDVKLLGREQEFLQQYKTHNEESSRIAYYRAALQQLPRLWIEFLAVAGLAVLIFIMVTKHKDPVDMIPVLALFAAAAFRLMPSVNRILGAVQAIRFGLPSINLLYTELNREEPAMGMVGGEAASFTQNLTVENVSFKYPNVNHHALKNVSMKISKGESIGFIGQSGSGKSTLIDVILGLLTPESGSIRFDEHDIQSNMRNWQNQIGYVPQAIFLTDDSLRRNVAFGLPDDQIDESKISHALRSAQLEEFVASLPEGLNTMVGERGVRLSGGQRQRIGIARALYHNPPVLVLDEATSALDMTTESEVMKSVNDLRGDKTIIIVAHRLSTVSRCDRIYRMAEGKVLGEGTPVEMIPLESVTEIRN